MGVYLTLYLETNISKGTACSKKGCGYKWRWEPIQHYTKKSILVKEQLTLHLETNISKGTACSKKGYGYKWRWESIQHYT
jgi:hypothetical protein